MEVYYVELRKATVLEKKFIYSMCWLFGMELQFGAHTRQHPPPTSPPTTTTTSTPPSPTYPPPHARPCPQAPGDFQKEKRRVFSLQKQQKRSRSLTVFWNWNIVHIAAQAGCGAMSSAGQGKRFGDVPSKCKRNCGSRSGKRRLRLEKQYFRPRIGES